MTPHRHITARILPVLGLLLALVLGAVTATAAPDRQNSTHLTYDERVEGQITSATTVQEWTFTGQTGDIVLLDMRAGEGSTLDTLLTLLDPAGNTVITDDDSGEGLNARIGPYPLEHSGTYTAIAGSYSGTGTYSLTLKNLHTLPTLTNGKTLVGTLDAEHPADYFALDVPPGDTVTLVRLEISDDNPYAAPLLSVYNTTGFVAGIEPGMAAEAPRAVLDPVALAPGETYVVVVAWNAQQNGGDYVLSRSPSALTLMEDGVPQSGNLDYNTFSRRHYFIAQQGDTVRVTIGVEGAITPALTITSAAFDAFLFANEGEHVRELDALITVPESGVYIVEVSDGSFAGGTGSYRLQLDWLAG